MNIQNTTSKKLSTSHYTVRSGNRVAFDKEQKTEYKCSATMVAPHPPPPLAHLSPRFANALFFSSVSLFRRKSFFRKMNFFAEKSPDLPLPSPTRDIAADTHS
jgi:hypothetical protein